MAKRTPECERVLEDIGDCIDALSKLRHSYKAVFGHELEPAAMLEMVRVLSWAAGRTLRAHDPQSAEGERADLIHAAIREGLTT